MSKKTAKEKTSATRITKSRPTLVLRPSFYSHEICFTFIFIKKIYSSFDYIIRFSSYINVPSRKFDYVNKRNGQFSHLLLNEFIEIKVLVIFGYNILLYIV